MDLNSLSSVRRRIATSSKRQALGSITIRCAFDVLPLAYLACLAREFPLTAWYAKHAN